MKNSRNQITKQSRESMRKGSLSFTFASRFLGARLRDDVVQLYAWCRRMDDVTDSDNASIDEKISAINTLAAASFNRQQPSDDPAILAFRAVAEKRNVPLRYAEDLVTGMRMDLRGVYIHTMSDLNDYSYHVAGTVGIMMAYIMGVSNEHAFHNACSLGIAMQYTNIARDVIADARMGRIYLPEDWLQMEGVPYKPEAILSIVHRRAITTVVKRLIDEADEQYRQGDEGLKYLPFRCAIAIAVAREVYAEIGRQVVARGSHAWDSRTVVTPWRKLVAAFHGIIKASATIPYRLGFATHTQAPTVGRNL